MGIVYLARDTKLGRRVAIKFLMAESRELIDGFLREARATAACHHENIVVIHEVDEHNGVPYMVLEYLEGQSLRGFIKGRQLSPSRTVELMVPVARALARAHELDIVHRDLKPENIFVTTSGTIKVLDFGIAALFHDQTVVTKPPPLPPAPPPSTVDKKPNAFASLADSDVASTYASGSSSGGYTGTLPYMSPEQFDGASVDARADLCALGVMLWEALAGHHPVQPLDSDALWRNAMQLDTPLPPIAHAVPGLPHKLAHLTDLCLQKRREKRMPSARAALDELESMLPSRTLRAQTDDRSPYPGLVAFQEDEADRFFGRGRDVLHVLSRLREHPLGAIIGPSGVGKSSFVRAGVIPGLKASGERWEGFVLRPGRQPLQSLATMLQPLTTSATSIADKMAEHTALVAKLADEPGYLGAVLRSRAAQRKQKILLFVDQFEELYTLVPDEAQRRAFVGCLSGVADDAAAPLRVLLSLRSDFLDRVGEDKRFADELARGLVLLQPLGREALREALRAPVEQLGHAFENDAMIEDMVQALASTPGALPLLQFAGAKLWEARDPQRKVLTQASYEQMGGISGVLAQHADQVVQALPLPMQRLVRSALPAPGHRRGDARHRRGWRAARSVERSARGARARRHAGAGAPARGAVARRRRDGDRRAGPRVADHRLAAAAPLARRGARRRRVPRAAAASGAAVGLARAARGPLVARRSDGGGAPLARAPRATAAGQGAAVPRRGVRAGDAGDARAARGGAGDDRVLVAGHRRRRGGAASDVRSAERHAVAEAERARLAEAQVTAQLDAIRRAQTEKQRAQAEVKRGKEDLRVVNEQLQEALTKSELEGKKAQDSAARAQTLASSLQKSNAQLEKLLNDARARAEKLERERRKITTELR